MISSGPTTLLLHCLLLVCPLVFTQIHSDLMVVLLDHCLWIRSMPLFESLKTREDLGPSLKQLARTLR